MALLGRIGMATGGHVPWLGTGDRKHAWLEARNSVFSERAWVGPLSNDRGGRANVCSRVRTAAAGGAEAVGLGRMCIIAVRAQFAVVMGLLSATSAHEQGDHDPSNRASNT